jgi:hypothetical protein
LYGSTHCWSLKREVIPKLKLPQFNYPQPRGGACNLCGEKVKKLQVMEWASLSPSEPVNRLPFWFVSKFPLLLGRKHMDSKVGGACPEDRAAHEA